MNSDVVQPPDFTLKRMRIFICLLLLTLITQSLSLSSNLLHCSEAKAQSSVTRVDDWSSAYFSSIQQISPTVVNNTLYYIASEYDENRNAVHKLSSFNTASQQRLIIHQVSGKEHTMNSISNIVTSGNSTQFHLVQIQRIPETFDFEAKLQILSIENNQIIGQYIYEDNSTEPVYFSNGTIARYQSTNNSLIFASIYTPIPIASNVLDKYTVLLVSCMRGGLKFVRIHENQVSSVLLIPSTLAPYKDLYDSGLMKVDSTTGHAYILIPLFFGYKYSFSNFHGVNASLFEFTGDEYSSIDVLIKVDVTGKVLGIQQIGLPLHVEPTLKFVSVSNMEVEWSVNGHVGINNVHVIGRVLQADGTYTAMYYRLSDVDKSAYMNRRDPDVYQIYTSIAESGKSSSAASILVKDNAIYIAGDANYVQVSTGSVTESPSSIVFRVDSQNATVDSAQVWAVVQGRSDDAYNLVSSLDKIYFASRYDAGITHSTDHHGKSAIYELHCSSQRTKPSGNLAIIITASVVGFILIVSVVLALILFVRSKVGRSEFVELK